MTDPNPMEGKRSLNVQVQTIAMKDKKTISAFCLLAAMLMTVSVAPVFAIEHQDSEAWKELAKGTPIAGEKSLEFTPFTARRVRLNLLKANEVIGGMILKTTGRIQSGTIRTVLWDAETRGEVVTEKAPKKNPSGALSTGKPATASSQWGKGFEASKAFDGDDESRWGAAPDAKSGWLEVDLGQNTEVGIAVIKELAYPRTEAFAIEYLQGKDWKELFSGNTIAGEKVLKFKPVPRGILG